MTAKANPDLSVDEIMRRWPATIRVFMRWDMLCVGCPIGTFHTLTEACEEHRLDEAELWNELMAAINASARPG